MVNFPDVAFGYRGQVHNVCEGTLVRLLVFTFAGGVGHEPIDQLQFIFEQRALASALNNKLGSRENGT